MTTVMEHVLGHGDPGGVEQDFGEVGRVTARQAKDGASKMRLCSHVVTVDAGLAPNPFHGYCTTAVCTPSHMNLKLEKGDWLIGNSPNEDGNRLVYAMRIADVLSMNQYFHDARFK